MRSLAIFALSALLAVCLTPDYGRAQDGGPLFAWVDRSGSLPGYSTGEVLKPALVVGGIVGGSMLLSRLVFPLPEPAFRMTGAELATPAGQARLAEFGEPVVVQTGRFFVRTHVGYVRLANGSRIAVERATGNAQVETSRVREAHDLRSGAEIAKVMRQRKAMTHAGGAAALLYFGSTFDDPDEAPIRTVMYVGSAVNAGLAIFALARESAIERDAASWRTGARFSFGPTRVRDGGRSRFGAGFVATIPVP